VAAVVVVVVGIVGLGARVVTRPDTQGPRTMDASLYN
jgi:hypothetical protein